MPKTYRVLPAPTAIATAGGAATTKAAQTYEGMIQAQAQQGWTFVCFDSTVVHNSECFGCSNNTIHIKLMVFSQDVP